MDSPGNHLHYPNMKHIPTYALYGEQHSAEDWLHWETIPARARQHDFRIAPHRHEHLFQVLLLSKGSALVTFDGADIALASETLLVVPALVVHGFAFSDDVDGIVLTLLERDVRALDLSFDQPAIIRTDIRLVREAIDRMIAEADHPGRGHDTAMRAHLTLLLIALHRAQSQAIASQNPADRMRIHVAKFQHLVELRFRQTRRIADYAGEMAVSPTHLNRICRQTLGTSALSVIERRIALEARRQLLFSTLSVKQIGAELGYDDPAYFTRFLTRMLGVSPTRFRQQMSRV
jgi:AraC family transcriptional activator of pobA